MTTEKLNLERDKTEKDISHNLNLDSSFSNYIDQKAIIPYKLFLKENIKSFNLLPNEEKCAKENELENSLKAKYNFDTPLLEIILKITSDYDLIQQQLREYLELFGEINSLKYDHNANSIKINYKYYFSCLYANRSLATIIQKPTEINSAINYYSNVDFSNKSINTAISNEKNISKISANKDFNQAFKFLTENYKTNTKFKTQIYKGENDENRCQNITDEELKINNMSEKRTNIEEIKNNEKEYMFSPKLKPSNEMQNPNLNSFNNSRTKNKCSNSNNNFYISKKKGNNSFSNPMNNLFFPPNLFYQYLSMNNPNTIKIPVPVPVPVPIPMTMPSPKFNRDPYYNSNKKEDFSSFSKTKIKSSCLEQDKRKEKENISISLNKTKMQTKSLNQTNSPQKKPELSSNNINNFCDTIIGNPNINNSEKSNTKSNNSSEKENNTSDFEKKEEANINSTEAKDGNSYKENISSSNASGKSSQEINEIKNDMVSSIKYTEKNKIDFLNTMDQRNLSLDRLNYFLQNNKPISNFNNPIKNLSSEENESIPVPPNNIPLPIFYPFPMQFPLNFPKFGRNRRHPNQYLFPNGFDKNIIDFDKLTLNTKNTIKFETYSSRDYYYKYVCNYLIQIENDDKFLVTKRIIGKNGCFLKKIIQEACIKYGDFSTKIRLRGKGSGYLEQNGKESEEPLMLCISSLNYPTYINCCLLIDSLLKKIYNDYYDYLLKVLSKDLHHSVIKKRILKHEYVVNRYASGISGKNKDNKNGNYSPHREDNSSQECVCVGKK
jgi:hypothetical protein